MTTEIKVIEQIENIKNFHKFTPEELEIYLERLNTLFLDVYHIDNFKYMIEKYIDFKNKIKKPDISELLLRKTIQIGQTVFKELKNVINIDKTFIIIPIIMLDDNTKKEQNIQYTHIKIRFDNIIYCITENLKKYVVPSNEEIKVIGLRISKLCNDTYNYIDLYLKDYLNMGTYDYELISKTCKYSPDYSYGSFIEKKDGTRADLPVNILLKNNMSIYENMFDYFVRFIKYYRLAETSLFIANTLGQEFKNYSVIIQPVKQLTDEKKLLKYDEKYIRFKKLIEDTTESIISTEYVSNLLHMLNNTSLFNIYGMFLIKGTDFSKLMIKIDILRSHIIREKISKTIKNKNMKELNELTSYKLIIGDKLGEQRLKELDKKMIHEIKKESTKILLSLLTEKERKIIISVYEKKQKYMKEIISNTCPHIQLHKKFRKAITNNQLAITYNNLKKFFNIDKITKISTKNIIKNEKTNEEINKFIKCNNCGFDLICPHIIDQTEMQIGKNRNYSFNEMRNRLFMYVDDTPYQGNYYCFICGEIIESVELFSSSTVTQTESEQYSSIEDSLKNQIWGEMTTIIKSFYFKTIVDISKIVNDMTEVCYEYIADIEQQLMKSKTNTTDDIKNKKRLFISIYGYAYMVNFILNNKTLEINLKNVKKIIDKSKPIDLLIGVTITILNTKNILINKISGITTEFIKNKLIDAYKLISGKGSNILQFSNNVYDIYMSIILDPLYKYVFEINHIGKGYKKEDLGKKLEYIMNINLSILGKKQMKKSNKKNGISNRISNKISNGKSNGMIDDISDEVNIEKIKDIYENIKIPNFSTWHIDKFNKIPKFEYGGFLDSKVVKGYKAESFKLFYDKIKYKLYFNFAYDDVGNFSEKLAKHTADYNLFHTNELQLIYYNCMNHIKSIVYHDGSGLIKFKYIPVSLGILYDENGNKHIWNKFIYKNGSELTKSEINKIIQEKQITDTYIDKRCSICGILESSVNELSNEKIIKVLKTKENIKNFFKFYENRCPEGGLHEFENNICKKCGLSIDNIKKIDSNIYTAEAKIYYEKYKKLYYEEKSEKQETEKIIKLPTISHDYTNEFVTWQFNYNDVLELSKILKTNIHILSNLGSIEKIDYNDVLSGSYVPLEEDTINSIRIIKLDSYVREYIFEYNRLRTYGLMSKPPEYLVKIIEQSGIKHHEYSKLSDMMPEIYNEFNEKLIWFKKNKKPKEVVDFIIYSIINMSLKIYKYSNKETQKLRELFVNYIVKYLFNRDKLTTQHSQFNWNVFAKKGDKFKDATTYNSNYDNDTGLETTNDMEENDLGDTFEPLKNKFDVDIDLIEGEENYMGDNDLNVGENYGLE